MKVLHLSSEKTWRGGEQQIAYLIEELDKQWNYIILYKASKTINYIINQHKNANRKGPYTVEISNNFYDLFSKYKIPPKNTNLEVFLLHLKMKHLIYHLV